MNLLSPACEKLEAQERAKLQVACTWHTWVHFIPLPGASVSLSESLGPVSQPSDSVREESPSGILTPSGPQQV